MMMFIVTADADEFDDIIRSASLGIAGMIDAQQAAKIQNQPEYTAFISKAKRYQPLMKSFLNTWNGMRTQILQILAPELN